MQPPGESARFPCMPNTARHAADLSMVKPLFSTDPASFFVIAGPCVIESVEQCLLIARHLKLACARLGLPYVFKASFDKANRSSGSSFRGPGMTDGLASLHRVREELGVPVLTDVHEPGQCGPVGEVVDVIQVPAFLARQTDLLQAAGRTGRVVNIKKGQFMSPAEMTTAVEKVRATGNDKVLLTERGTFFGYHRLVNDFTGLSTMAQTGAPVVFDITHSTQAPAGLGSSSGGSPEHSPMLARCAMAAGCKGIFLECHPEPSKAKSDAATVLALDSVEGLLRQCAEIARLRAGW